MGAHNVKVAIVMHIFKLATDIKIYLKLFRGERQWRLTSTKKKFLVTMSVPQIPKNRVKCFSHIGFMRISYCYQTLRGLWTYTPKMT